MTGVVRPFEARVVRQEWAARAVTPMMDALGMKRPPTLVPATAYEHSPRAFYVYRIALRRLDVAQRLIDVSARSAELTQSLVDAGELRGVDALQTQADLARAEVTKARLAVTVESRMRELEAVLGAPLGAAVAVDGELMPPPAIEWNATLARIESESPY